MGIVTERAIARNIQPLARDQRRHREHPATETLADHHHVRNDAIALECEHRPGAAKADRNLVENEKRAMAVAGAAHRFVVPPGGHLDIGRAHGLDHHRGNVFFLAQDVLDVLGATRVAGAAAAVHAMLRIAGRRVFGARQERPDAGAKHRLAADRDRIQRRAVKRVPQRHGLVPPGRHARELERHADRFGASRSKQHLAEVARRKRRQAAREPPPRRW